MINSTIKDFVLENLIKKYWRFSFNEDINLVDALRFRENGEIWGYRNDNERFWKYEDNTLYFLNKDKIVSAEFKDIEITKESVIFKGQHILSPNGPKFILKSQPDSYKPKSPAEYYVPHPQIKVGDHSYGNVLIIDSEIGNPDVLEIGKYTSIADNVRLIAGNHNYKYVSTYPFKSVASQFWRYLDNDIKDHIYNKKTIIGSDVWIGCNVIIRGGITIGNGSIIAAGSIVTNDVEPYTIVGGVPAKILKKRFTDSQIKKLNQIRWWEWDDEKVNENLIYIMSEDIDRFIEMFYQENK